MKISLSKQDKRFIGAIALVHLVYFMLALHYTRIYMGDSVEYIYEALNIKTRFFFYAGNPALPISPEYMTQRQPGYPLFLLSVYLFSVNNWIVLVLQNLLSIFNIWYCRNAALLAGYQKKYDWLLLALLLACPSQFVNANTIAPDILLQTFTVLYFGCFLRLWHTRHLKYAFFMSLALVAGMMVKPVLYPFAAVHFLLLTALFIAWRIKMQRPLLLAMIPLCAVMLYDYSNYTRTGKFHFSSNQAFNAVFYMYTFTASSAGTDSAYRFLQNERANVNAIPDYKERYEYANSRGSELLRQHFMPYIAFHLGGATRIFIDPGKAELDLFTGKLTYGKLYSQQQTGFFATLKKEGIGGLSSYISRNPSLPLALLILLFNCLRTAGLVLFLLRKTIAWPVQLFTFLLISYFAVAAGPIANTRYLLPVVLIIICCSVTGFIFVLPKRNPA